MRSVAGVDEAGRGSVLGPLLVAGVSIDERDVPKLVKMGVKDSKLITSKTRVRLYREICKVARKITWERTQPPKIDRIVFEGTRLFRLNYLEAQMMASVLSRLRFDVGYVDCCDTIQTRFGDLVADLLFEKTKARDGLHVSLGEENPFRRMIVSEHHADSNYAVVGAASIIAKVRRDACITALQKKHGRLGSGYPSDPETLVFLEKLLHKETVIPGFIRSSWATIRKIKANIDENSKLIAEFPVRS